MRSPFHDSEFSRNLDRHGAEPRGPYEPELGSLSNGADGGRAGVDSDDIVKTGTTTVGLTATDGVVLAADQRASLGGRVVANKNVQKIEELQPNAAMTMAGAVGGAQAFIRQVRAETNLYEARRGEYMDIDALSTMMSNLLHAAGAAFLVTPILGGFDGDGAHVYSLDPGGSSLADKYTATGSGMQYALGVLEQQYADDLTLEEAAPVAARAIRSATERDTGSGNGVHVARVTADGVDIRSYEDFDEVV